MSPEGRDALERARGRLDRLDFDPRPVRMRRVRIVSTPWFFRLPYFRRFDGHAFYETVMLRDAVGAAPDDLVTHELCHVWQMQHHPIAMPLSYLYRGYKNNPYEIEARRAVALTREPAYDPRSVERPGPSVGSP